MNDSRTLDIVCTVDAIEWGDTFGYVDDEPAPPPVLPTSMRLGFWMSPRDIAPGNPPPVVAPLHAGTTDYEVAGKVRARYIDAMRARDGLPSVRIDAGVPVTLVLDKVRDRLPLATRGRWIAARGDLMASVSRYWSPRGTRGIRAMVDAVGFDPQEEALLRVRVKSKGPARKV